MKADVQYGPIPEPAMDNHSAESVTRWIDGLKRGDDAAATALWQRYVDRLVRLAQGRLRPAHRRVADEEDVALSAFRALCDGAARGRFTDLADRNDLWRLLTVLTVHKAIDARRHTTRQKRGGGVRGESVFDEMPGDARGLDQFLSDEPTPEVLAMFAEEHQRLLNALGDDTLRRVALDKLAGFTNEEIAQRLEMTCRSVERKLQRIRTRWLRSLTP